MSDLNNAWSELIHEMIKESDQSSDADMDMFNTCARAINEAVSWFTTYHAVKERNGR